MAVLGGIARSFVGLLCVAFKLSGLPVGLEINDLDPLCLEANQNESV
jgi:hypothetical protein